MTLRCFLSLLTGSPATDISTRIFLPLEKVEFGPCGRFCKKKIELSLARYASLLKNKSNYLSCFPLVTFLSPSALFIGQLPLIRFDRRSARWEGGIPAKPPKSLLPPTFYSSSHWCVRKRVDQVSRMYTRLVLGFSLKNGDRGDKTEIANCGVCLRQGRTNRVHTRLNRHMACIISTHPCQTTSLCGWWLFLLPLNIQQICTPCTLVSDKARSLFQSGRWHNT